MRYLISVLILIGNPPIVLFWSCDFHSSYTSLYNCSPPHERQPQQYSTTYYLLKSATDKKPSNIVPGAPSKSEHLLIKKSSFFTRSS